MTDVMMNNGPALVQWKCTVYNVHSNSISHSLKETKANMLACVLLEQSFKMGECWVNMLL